MVKYIYNKTQFPAQKFNLDNLCADINNVLEAGLFDYANGYPDKCELFFARELTTNEKRMVDILVSNHNSNNNSESYTNVINVNIETFDKEEPIVVAQTFAGIQEYFTVKGRHHTAPANQLTFFDIEITNEIRLKGGGYDIINFNDTNTTHYIEFSIIDKNNILGKFQDIGLVVGEDILELAKFVRTEYITEKSKTIENGYQAKYIYPGLFLRVAYDNTSDKDINFVSKFYYYE